MTDNLTPQLLRRYAERWRTDLVGRKVWTWVVIFPDGSKTRIAKMPYSDGLEFVTLVRGDVVPIYHKLTQLGRTFPYTTLTFRLTTHPRKNL